MSFVGRFLVLRVLVVFSSWLDAPEWAPGTVGAVACWKVLAFWIPPPYEKIAD